jgi:hypothetical protein
MRAGRYHAKYHGCGNGTSSGEAVTRRADESHWRKILHSIQPERIENPVRSKFAMVVPILEATLVSLRKTASIGLDGSTP